MAELSIRNKTVRIKISKFHFEKKKFLSALIPKLVKNPKDTGKGFECWELPRIYLVSLSTRNDRGNAGRTIDLEIVDVGVKLSPE